MNIFKNRFNLVLDQYNKNINNIINIFDPKTTAIFLFSEQLDNKELISIVGDRQTYTDIKLLEKIHYISNFYKDVNKIIIIIDMSTNDFIQELDELNITYIYCSSNIINHNKLNIILPEKNTIEQTKRFFRIFNINKRIEEYYEYINSQQSTLVYKIEEKWNEYQYNGDYNYSEYIYKYLDDYCANDINYNIIEKPKISSIINKDDDFETNINRLLSIPPIKKDPNQTLSTSIQYQYLDNINRLDKLKDLLDSII